MISLHALVSILAVIVGVLSLLGFTLLEFAPNTRISLALSALFKRSFVDLKELNRLSIFDVDDFARIEKFIPNIHSVVVVSRRIDEPRQGLHDAIYDNFQQGARYSFFISNTGHTPDEIAHYKSWFRAIFDLAKDAAPEDGDNSAIRVATFEALLSIKALPVAWSHVPYVFYTYKDESGEFVTLALKGTTPGVGISTRYLRVEPTEAMAILELCALASTDFDEMIGTPDVVLEPVIPETKVTYIHQDRQDSRQAVG